MQSVGVLNSGGDSNEFSYVQLDPDRPSSKDPCDFTNLDYNLATPGQPSQSAADDQLHSTLEQGSSDDNPNDMTKEDMVVLKHARDLSKTVVRGGVFS